ncbi:MAG: hypothetical protein KIS88_00235 [Anaerolineales bacterium]|nr:hypothetical protein [Anaerolineales bacterium]
MPAQTTTAQFAKHLHQALQSLSKRAAASPALERLQLYEQVCSQPGRTGRKAPASVELFVRRTLREFRSEHPGHAQLLTRRFVEQETAKEIAHSLSISQETVNRNQQRAIQRFADWLLAQEQQVHQQRRSQLLASLPPASFGELVGVSALQKKLVGLLRRPQLPWVVCLTGIGGIGKSSLANQAARNLLDNSPYTHILWLKAAEGQPLSERTLLAELSRRLLPTTLPASERLAALQQRLKLQPHLIVLEDVDSELANPAWVDWLHSFANPSRFLLCSRQLPAALARAYTLPVGELSAKAALALMSYQAREVGLEAALPALRKHAAALYARTGGNPLALKLAVGLLHSWPITSILDALQERSQPDIAALYTAIYQASWQALSDDGRRLLLAMPLVAAEGAGLAQLRAISGLGAAALRNAIRELHIRSLLEASGSADSVRYSIHQLTRSFVRQHILDED